MKINIQKLSEGIHEVSEEISAEDLGLSQTVKTVGKLKLNAFVDKFEDSFRIKLNIIVDLIERCDKCLEEFNAEIDESGEQIYQVGEGDYTDDDIEVLPDNTREIDLSKLIIEVFLINRPIQKICREDCRGLCPDCGKNLNQTTCSCKSERIDPRLEKLKSLIK
ncbi:MAG: DUF177 domain-containing protein [Calditrichia bacterium]|nr:DUF177 domain-containing protein [Calditrichia bacterium]